MNDSFAARLEGQPGRISKILQSSSRIPDNSRVICHIQWCAAELAPGGRIEAGLAAAGCAACQSAVLADGRFPLPAFEPTAE